MATSEDEYELRVFKPRKSHTKSRNGCLACKKQRRKCDELRPRCSRCSKRNTTCRYAVQHERTHPGSEEFDSPSPLPLAARGAGWPKASAVLEAGLPTYLSVSSNGTSLADTLAATELDLLARYLTHTSHIIPVDEIDVYALQIGIPNLAFRSPPLMDSVLALAAISRCHEILNSAPTVREWQELEDLLALANHRYESSLHRVQGISCDPNQYDSVVANATLMVLYGSADHSLRIRLAESGLANVHMVSEFAPVPLQWTSLIRAAHLAYEGLKQCDLQEGAVIESPDELDISVDSPEMGYFDAEHAEEAGPPRLSHSVPTTHFIHPIIATTSTRALQRLSNRLQAASSVHIGSSMVERTSPMLSHCSDAFAELCDTFNIVTMSAENLLPAGKTKSATLPKPNRRSVVPPWLRTYVARVTSAVPQKELRRIIMSFLKRVPAEYLELVHQLLDESPMQGECLAVSQIALDIFAHWLVLVTLLDGVWWIGGIGEWELERTVNRFKELHAGVGIEYAWWPERMLEIRQELLDDGEITPDR